MGRQGPAASRHRPPPAPGRRFPGNLLAVAAAALVPLAAYWPTTRYGFLLDDFVLFQSSPSLSDPGSIPRGFLLDVGAVRQGWSTIISSYYRPVFLALSTLYYQFAGGQPPAWHAACVALAALIGALVCLLLLRLGLAPRLALLAAVVFSLHPSHVGSVAWASGLQDLLAAAFSCLALLAGLWHTEDDRNRWPYVLAGSFFALALLSKEVSIGLLPLVGAWALHASRGGEPLTRRLVRLTGVLGGVTLVYLAVRIAVLGGLASPPPTAPSLGSALWSVPVALLTYLRLLVWPVDFSFFRPERPLGGPFEPQLVLTVAVLIGLGALAGWAIRKRRGLFLPMAWLVAWLLPVLNLWALDREWMVVDRYLFLPALALPWTLAILAPRRVAIAVLALLAVAFAALEARYAAIFHDQRTFLAAMEKAEPTSSIVFGEKGRLLLRDGDLPAARAALRRALEIDPLDPGASLSLGDLERQQGELAAAEHEYRRALVVRPHASRPFKQLAIAWARAGQGGKALSLIEESARRWPADFEVQLLDALLLGANGEHDRAAAAFDRARRLRPGDPGVAGGLDATMTRLLPTIGD